MPRSSGNRGKFTVTYTVWILDTVWGPKLLTIAKVRVRELGIKSRVLFGVGPEKDRLWMQSENFITLLVHCSSYIVP